MPDLIEKLNALTSASRALIAVGDLGVDVGERVVRDVQAALLTRGHTWVDVDLGDARRELRSLGALDNAPGELVSVVARPEARAERWTERLIVSTTVDGAVHHLPAATPDEQSLLLRSARATVELDLTGGRAARHVPARTVAVDRVAYVTCLPRNEQRAAARVLGVEAGEVAPSPDVLPEPCEAVAVAGATGDGDVRVVVTAIDDGAIAHLWVRGIDPVALWVRSDRGLHPQQAQWQRSFLGRWTSMSYKVAPPLPPPPRPATLVVVGAGGGGAAIEVDLR